MIIPKDIFTDAIEYIRFLLYLFRKGGVTVEQMSSEFNISKWLLYKRVKYWEEQGDIILITTVGKKGGKQYRYQATDRIKQKSRDILGLLLKNKE